MLIDTYKTVKDLTAAGADEHLAEAIVRAITTADEQVATKDDLEDLRIATQRDLEDLRTAMQQEFNGVQQEFKGVRQEFKNVRQEMKALEARLMKTFWRGLFTACALIIAAMAALLAVFV